MQIYQQAEGIGIAGEDKGRFPFPGGFPVWGVMGGRSPSMYLWCQEQGACDGNCITWKKIQHQI
jgi:hypothetical protein